LTADHRPQIQAVLDLLAVRWPKTFSVYEARRRPLKIGIHGDILAALDGGITPDELKLALAHYCRNPVYLRKILPGTWRYDLDGNHVGEVTANEAADAKRRLAEIEKIKADRAAAKKAAEEAAEIARRGPRLSLADLKASALARKAAAVLAE
jgi:ProP effector